MRVGRSQGLLVIQDKSTGPWRKVRTGPRDVLECLVHLKRTSAELDLEEGSASAPTGLPFAPGSLRSFALWEKHMLAGARGMVRKFGSPLLKMVMEVYEATTRQDFPPLRPKANYRRWPSFYLGNHRSLFSDGSEIPWPAYSQVLDFELEIGAVLIKEIRDCSPEEALEAIGGFVILNDWTARDTQWSDTWNGPFGGVVKGKTFAGSMGAFVVSADEVLPNWTALGGRVRVNGEVWCEGSAIDPTHGLGEAIAYAAWSETLYPGDVISTGTLPGCCGLEIGRFVKPEDTVELEIEGWGSLTNRLGQAPLPQNMKK